MMAAFIIMIGFWDTGFGQASSSEGGLIERLTADIKPGNLIFIENFRLALKTAAAYKVTDAIHAGVHAKIDYKYLSKNKVNAFDLGFGPFARCKVAGGFFIQAEYAWHSFDNKYLPVSEKLRFDPEKYTGDRISARGALLGFGYSSGYGPWAFGSDIMFHTSSTIQDITLDVLEWYVGVSYNF